MDIFPLRLNSLDDFTVKDASKLAITKMNTNIIRNS